ncbi:MAG TPA: hypothetical protein VFH56_16915 [Acidimicrobiales bacterium]|nr:hypothetical protein [Acidimicrobiales bacterium]
MVRWDGVGHIAWNIIASLVWVVAIIAVVRVPTDRFSKGWRTKAWAIVGAAVAVYFAGFYLPVGALIGFTVARRHRRVSVETP